MTEIRKKPVISGVAGTIILWLLMFILFAIFSALAPKPYKSIKIRLDAPVSPKEKPVEQSKAAAAAEKAAQPQKAEQASKKTESAKNAVAAPAKSESAPARQSPKAREQVLQKSMEELMAEQRTAKKQKKEVDWDSMFADSDEKTSGSPVKNASSASPAAESALSGSSASAAKASENTAAVTSSSSRKTDSHVSGETSAALGRVSQAKFSSRTGSVDSNVTAETGTSPDGKTTMQMADGTPRILLEPSSPVIILSPQAAALIDSTKKLEITFTVSAAGNVVLNSIKISPDILPSRVSSEIKQQISSWRFASASESGTAVLKHTIEKR